MQTARNLFLSGSVDFRRKISVRISGIEEDSCQSPAFGQREIKRIAGDFGQHFCHEAEAK